MKILVPIDGSEFSKHSIEFVTSRATLLGHNPEIELLSVQAPVPARASKLIGNGSLSGYYDEEANVILEPAIEALKAAGVKATARYAVGEAAPTIAKVAEESGADLIIMGSHGRSALKGLLLGSVTNSVLALCDKPVLILRNKPAPTNDSLKVGVAIDGSKYGEAAVEHILKNHDIFGDHPTFYLMNVVSDYAGVVMPDMAGNPGDEIAAFAKNEGLDLIVMGTRGYGAFKAAVLGSTATRIAAISDTPLLVIQAN